MIHWLPGVEDASGSIMKHFYFRSPTKIISCWFKANISFFPTDVYKIDVQYFKHDII